MRDDPIARRNANHRSIDCPGFWRRFGSRFFLFLAVYPWVVVVVLFACKMYRLRITRFGFLTLPPSIDNLLYSDWLREIGEVAVAALCLPALFLFPVGLVWWVMAWNACEKGFVSGRFCLVCSVLFFGGIAAIFLVPGLLARL